MSDVFVLIVGIGVGFAFGALYGWSCRLWEQSRD